MPPLRSTLQTPNGRAVARVARRLSVLGLGLYWPFLALATHWPRLHLPLAAATHDKLLHYLSFGWLTLLVYGALAPRPRLRRAAWTAATVIAYAAIDEWTQRWAAGRTASLHDFLANALGAAFVLSGALLWPRQRQPSWAGTLAGLARFLLLVTLPLLVWATTMPSGTVRQAYRAIHLPYVLHLFDHRFTQDKQAHVLVMLPLTWLLLLARPLGVGRFWRGAALSAIVLAASAPAVEWLQQLTGSGRDWEWADIAFHEIGLALALLTFAAVALPAGAIRRWSGGHSGWASATGADFVGHAKLISFLTLISRVLGMLRESVMAAYLGATLITDAFYFAFTVPNLFRKLFGEGALSAAFIPLYTQSLKSEGPEKANQFAAASVTLLSLILLGLTIVGELLLWGLARVVRPEQLLLVKLTAIMLPYVLLICGTAFLSGILQAHRRFGLAAATPFVLNIVHIAVIVIGAAVLGLNGQDAPERLALQTTLIYWLACFVLVAGAMQVLLLVPSLHAIGFRFRLRGWSPTVKRMLELSVPVALSAGVLQGSVLIDKTLPAFLSATDGATHFTLLGYAIRYPVEAGAVARLNWAQFLYQFPLGVFAIAVATAIFPSLSAEALGADRQRFRCALHRGVLVTLLEGFSASVGLIIVAYPAVRVLFHVDAHSTELIVRSTVLYSTAIAAYSLQQIINRAYYSLHDMTTPFVMSIITLAVNTVVEIPLLWTPLAESGMAAGTAVSFSIQAVVMLIMLDRKVGGLDLARIAVEALKMLFAALVMGLACTVIQRLPLYPQGDSRWTAAAQLLLLIPLGAAVYLATCALLRTGGLSTFLGRQR